MKQKFFGFRLDLVPRGHITKQERAGVGQAWWGKRGASMEQAWSKRGAGMGQAWWGKHGAGMGRHGAGVG